MGSSSSKSPNSSSTSSPITSKRKNIYQPKDQNVIKDEAFKSAWKEDVLNNPYRSPRQSVSWNNYNKKPFQTKTSASDNEQRNIDNLTNTTNKDKTWVQSKSSCLSSGNIKETSGNKKSEENKKDNADITKHEIFLKKLAANFNVNSRIRNRGTYCNVCSFYNIHYSKDQKHEKHDESESHVKNVKESLEKNKSNIKRYYCRQCRAHFFGDINFWIDHLNMELHKFFSYKTKKAFSNKNKCSLPQHHGNNRVSVDLGIDSSLNDQPIEKKSRFYALLLKDLPTDVTRRVVFDSMKDFGRLDTLFMHFDGPDSAKITFKYRFNAINIVENGVPIKICGKTVQTSLIEV